MILSAKAQQYYCIASLTREVELWDDISEDAVQYSSLSVCSDVYGNNSLYARLVESPEVQVYAVQY